MINLHDTKLTVSPLCLGTGSYGTGIDEATSFALMDRFVELGGNVLDTANVYGKWGIEKTNTSEQIIGKWLKANGNCKNIVLCSKGCHYEMDTPHIQRVTPEALWQDLAESMETLGVDSIDLQYLHRDNPAVPVGEMVDALHEAVHKGLVRHVGVSNWTAERIIAAQDYARNKYGIERFLVADQMMWNLAIPNRAEPAGPYTLAMNDALFAFHQRSGMAVFAYSSQANGFFSKALQPDFETNPAYDGIKRAFLNEETNRRVELVRAIAAETGFDGTQIALAWLLNQPIVTVPIIGCRTVEQLESSFGALDAGLKEVVVEKLKMEGHRP
ncbi:MAG: aldo/keto reductase [Anaerolineae bacterium]|jgi:aryl-alcohol dehydrogenase-like predicted oxidoreductase|nr:aldo/keto reductase [Anaerolineae bacterium]